MKKTVLKEFTISNNHRSIVVIFPKEIDHGQLVILTRRALDRLGEYDTKTYFPVKPLKKTKLNK